jgi:hypothetical protein
VYRILIPPCRSGPLWGSHNLLYNGYRVLLMDLVEVGWGDVDWLCLAHDRDRWRALVNSVLNVRVP